MPQEKAQPEESCGQSGSPRSLQGDDSVDRHLLLMARESLRCMIVSLSFFPNFSVWLL